jgi:hypothetical protein
VDHREITQDDVSQNESSLNNKEESDTKGNEYIKPIIKKSTSLLHTPQSQKHNETEETETLSNKENVQNGSCFIRDPITTKVIQDSQRQMWKLHKQLDIYFSRIQELEQCRLQDMKTIQVPV